MLDLLGAEEPPKAPGVNGAAPQFHAGAVWVSDEHDTVSPAPTVRPPVVDVGGRGCDGAVHDDRAA